MRGSCGLPGSAAAWTFSAAAPRHRGDDERSQAHQSSAAMRSPAGPRRELHVMRAAELRRLEVRFERQRELLAVPVEGAQELLVVRALLVPFRQQARRDVHALAVPALRDHVDLLAGLLRIGLDRMLGIEIEVTGRAVHERIDPQPLAVRGYRDVHGQRNLRGIADRADFLRLPLARRLPAGSATASTSAPWR